MIAHIRGRGRLLLTAIYFWSGEGRWRPAPPMSGSAVERSGERQLENEPVGHGATTDITEIRNGLWVNAEQKNSPHRSVRFNMGQQTCHL